MALSESPTEVHAAIDLGTNSFHLLVAEVNAEGRLEILTREKEPVRLGSGSGDMTELDPDAIDRGIDCLKRFKKIADTFNADITAVATSATREAANKEVFVNRARKEAGINVSVISGVEEARLIHLGVLQAVPVFKKQVLVIDIGGGSTESIIGMRGKVIDARSQKLGHIRLTERFFADGRIRKGSVEECRTYIRSFLAPVARDLSKIGFETAVGSSGTIGAIAGIIEHRKGREPNRSVNNVTFTSADLAETIDELLAAKTAKQRLVVGGLDEGRADVIVGGALLLEGLFETLDIKEMTVSSYALREGVLLDQVRRGNKESFHHLSDLRRERVLRLADAFHEDLDHVLHATDLSLEIFDATHSLHGLGLAQRDLLESAGMLHNVGLFVSHAAHHKHSYYVIRNSDQLVGFTEQELELIAQVARYHRKSLPKPKHVEYMSLRAEDRQTVSTLAGMLRVGIALDRTRSAVVADVECELSANGRTIIVKPAIRKKADASLELYTARERCDLLAVALKKHVEIVG